MAANSEPSAIVCNLLHRERCFGYHSILIDRCLIRSVPEGIYMIVLLTKVLGY
jgi:hypothetical protein